MFLCSGLPTQVLIIVLVRALGIEVLTADGLLSPTFVFVVSMTDAIVVVLLVLVFLRAHGESAREVLIGRRPVLREAGLGVVLIPIVFVLVAVILGLVLEYAPYLRNVPKNPLENMLRSRAEAIVFAFVAMIAGGLREEVQRGFIVHRFDQYLGGGALGVIVYSLAFGLGHFEQGWDASIATAVLGATWGFVYLRRRSIVAPLVSHAGFNLAQVLKVLALR